jgi:hypothetical protein
MTNNVFAIWYEKSSDRQNIRHGQYWDQISLKRQCKHLVVT